MDLNISPKPKPKRKKKIVVHSNQTRALTGFGKHTKNLLKYLFETGKYEIVEFCNGAQWSHPNNDTLPWKCRGSLPDDQKIIEKINKKGGDKARNAGYGSEMVDEVIKTEKPDIYVGIEDIWGFSGYWNRKWWNKVNCMIWTTLDSLPILPEAVQAAPKIKHYYVWATFAEKEMKRIGHEHVKTLHGCLDTKMFYRLNNQQRNDLRQRFEIDLDTFVVGFVFRNQLRKSVPNLLEGFRLFKQKNPSATKAKLLLHTSWEEGWDIPRLLKEKNIDSEDILTTYFCPGCNSYDIKKFVGKKNDCRFCGSKQSQETTNVRHGVSDEQLNEIYNLMDTYCHPFTSGGQEIPVQEAKLTELITLVTNYSCGSDSCSEESAGLPLKWSEYREPGTQFIKASTSAEHISTQLNKVFKMKPEKKQALGQKARKYVIEHYGVEVIGKKFEKIIDSVGFTDWDFDFTERPRDPAYNPPNIEDNSKWLLDLYKNILKRDIDNTDDGHQYWMGEFAKGANRKDVLLYFKKAAVEENQKLNKVDFESLLDSDDKGKRIAMVVPDAKKDIFNITSLLPSIKRIYPDYNLYFITNPDNFSILDGNPFIHKVLPFSDELEDLFLLEGRGDHKGYFEIAYLPHFTTQKMVNFIHNNQDKPDFDVVYRD